jgi:FlaA1/EpsC-like NDP-sugar epimerase
MENQPTVSRKGIMINFGVLFGFASIITQLLIYVFGDIYKPHWSFMVLSVAVTAIFIVLGIKKVKDSQGGFLSMGDAIKTGLGIALISSIIYSIYLVIFQHLIEPSYFENLALLQEQTILEQNPNMTDEQLEQAKGFAAMFNSSGVNVAITIIFSLFMGLIISFFSGLVMKKSEM